MVCPGSGGTPATRKKHVFSKAVVIILLLCVVLTTIALFSLVACYFLRKDKLSFQSRIYSFDKYHSSNSRSNLISNRSASSPESLAKVSSGFGLRGKLHLGCQLHFSLIPF